MSNASMGKRFGKPDIERLGLFSEMGYMNGKGYVPLKGKPNYIKGANMLNTGRKTKNGTQHGYFDDEYKRLFIGEAVVRDKKKIMQVPTVPFILNFVPKKHSTPGDTYGTFTKEMEAFSPKAIKRKFVHEPGNFVWRCGKIGGPGYADTGMDKYPEHWPDRYGLKQKVKVYGRKLDGPFINSIYPQAFFEEKSPYTEEPLPTVGLYLNREKNKSTKVSEPWVPNGPAKSQGGSHAGCFDKFPEWQPCKYMTMAQANKPRGSGKLDCAPFIPNPRTIKTMNTNCVVDQSVDVFMNTDNAQTYIPCYIDRLKVDLYA